MSKPTKRKAKPKARTPSRKKVRQWLKFIGVPIPEKK